LFVFPLQYDIEFLPTNPVEDIPSNGPYIAKAKPIRKDQKVDVPSLRFIIRTRTEKNNRRPRVTSVNRFQNNQTIFLGKTHTPIVERDR